MQWYFKACLLLCIREANTQYLYTFNHQKKKKTPTSLNRKYRQFSSRKRGKFLNMKKERQFLCFLVVMYPLKISCLLYALLTDYWVETDDFHFGLYKYCVDNTSTCLDVTIQLQTIEGILWQCKKVYTIYKVFSWQIIIHTF